MKQIYFLFLLLFFVSSTYALTIDAGEPYTFEVEEQYDYYTIAGNSTPIELEVSQEGNVITIIPNKYLRDETFSIIFFKEDEITKEVYVGGGGGGGSKTIYKDRNITQYVDREVEKIVEVTNDEEIDGYIDIANESLKREHWWRIGFAIACVLLLIIGIWAIRKERESYSPYSEEVEDERRIG
jgi:hypothetical protein